MLRRNEKDFMSRNEIKYHDRLEVGIKSFKGKLINIHRVLVVEGIDINSDSLGLIQSIDEYGYSFHELILFMLLLFTIFLFRLVFSRSVLFIFGICLVSLYHS